MEKIAMKISEEEYNDIFPVLEENVLVESDINTWSHSNNYLVNIRKNFLEGVNLYALSCNIGDYKILPYNKELFLQYCGINTEETFEQYIKRVNSTLYSSFLAEKELKKRKPLFKTEDGIDVYENDIAYWVLNNKEDIRYLHSAKFNKLEIELLNKINSVYKVFSTQEAVEQYIAENTTQRTFDMYNIKNKEEIWVVDTQFYGLQQSVGGCFKKDNGKNLLFKHKGNAINHIILNKKTLSLSDLDFIVGFGEERLKLIRRIKEKLGF